MKTTFLPKLLSGLLLGLSSALLVNPAHAERPGAYLRGGVIGAPAPGVQVQPIPHPQPVQPIGGRISGRGTGNGGVTFGPIGAPRPTGYVPPGTRTGIPLPAPGYRGGRGR